MKKKLKSRRQPFPMIFLLTYMVANFLHFFTMLRSFDLVTELFHALSEEFDLSAVNFYIGLSLIVMIISVVSLLFDYLFRRWLTQKITKRKNVYQRDYLISFLLSYSFSAITGLALMGLPFIGGLNARSWIQNAVQMISFIYLFKDEEGEDTEKNKDPKVIKVASILAVVLPLLAIGFVYGVEYLLVLIELFQ